jgi:hypothetical protein
MTSELAWWLLFGLFVVQLIFNAMDHARHMAAMQRHIEWLKERIAIAEEETRDAE